MSNAIEVEGLRYTHRLLTAAEVDSLTSRFAMAVTPQGFGAWAAMTVADGVLDVLTPAARQALEKRWEEEGRPVEAWTLRDLVKQIKLVIDRSESPYRRLLRLGRFVIRRGAAESIARTGPR